MIINGKNIPFKNIIIEFNSPEGDNKHLASLYEKLKVLKREMGMAPHKSKKWTLFKDEITNTRNEIKAKIKLFTITVGRKGSNEFVMYDYNKPFTRKEIKECIINYFNELTTERKERTTDKQEVKSMLGFKYTTVGGTFSVPGSIFKLASTIDHFERIRSTKAPAKNSKNNYVGIELELVSRVSREALEKLLIKEGMSGYVQLKGDSSIHPEHIAPNETAIEVAIMCRQEEMSRVVTTVCKVLNGDQVKAYVNNSCGLHVHLDARNRSPEVMYTKLVKALPLLTKMVPYNRVKGSQANQYCAVNSSEVFNASGARYQAINPSAYNKYKTIEVRLHSGTTNARKIINWTDICLAIISSATTETLSSVEDARSLMFMGDKDSVLSYMNERINLFSKYKEAADTRFDHFSEYVA